MNILKDFRDAISNVGEELKASLKSKNKTDYKDLTVYLGPGAVRLLDSKNLQWSEIHDENTVLVNKVKVIDETLVTLYRITNHNFNQINQLEQELSNISTINTHVNQLNSLCASLQVSLEALEDDLAVFENKLEEDKFIKYQQNIERMVSVHESECVIKLDLLKKKLAAKLVESNALKEKNIQKQLTERQKTFDEEYQRDLNEYLQKGRLEKHVSDPLDLSKELDIPIEQSEKDKLDEFLN